MHGALQPSAASSALQRGRAPGGAEFDFVVREAARDVRASTGPRPGGRGIQAQWTPEGVSKSLLQRGRAPGGAEFGYYDKRDLPVKLASTGPRPGGRGI